MFTGIVEQQGKIASISRGSVIRIVIRSTLENRPGDSIAVQGICLTVVEVMAGAFAVEAMAQTAASTTLRTWKAGDAVNLERALTLQSRLGGHILQGHVDDCGKVVRVRGNEIMIKTKRTYLKYLVPRGSIGIDGISLTIAAVRSDTFSVAIIPWTREHSTIGRMRPGSFVNLEFDHFARLST